MSDNFASVLVQQSWIDRGKFARCILDGMDILYDSQPNVESFKRRIVEEAAKILLETVGV